MSDRQQTRGSPKRSPLSFRAILAAPLDDLLKAKHALRYLNHT